MCAAAEVVAGVVRANNSTESNVWPEVIPVLLEGLEVASYEWSSDWADAVRFMSGKRLFVAMQPLVDALMDKVKTCFQTIKRQTSVDSITGDEYEHGATLSVKGDDFSTQAKYLRVIQGLLVELAAVEGNADMLCIELLPLLLENLAHPYKLCRESIGRTLFLVFDWALSPPSSCLSIENDDALATNSHDKIRLAALARIRKVLFLGAGGGSTDPDDEARAVVARCARETVMNWLVTSTLAGDSARHVYWAWPSLLPPLFEGLTDPDPEHSSMVKGVLRFLAQAASPTRALGGTESEAAANWTSLAEHASWKVREEAVRLMAVLGARCLRLDTSSGDEVLLGAGVGTKKMRSFVHELLGDDRREVAEAAREAASLDVLVASDAATFAQTFEDLAQSCLKKRRKAHAKKNIQTPTNVPGAPAAPIEPPGGGDAALSVQRAKSDASFQRGAMGLAAVALAHPYAVEPQVPAAIKLLAQLSAAPRSGEPSHSGTAQAMVTEVVKATFLEFKRTHLDEWSRHREAFDVETLDAFNDCFDAPSYFA